MIYDRKRGKRRGGKGARERERVRNVYIRTKMERERQAETGEARQALKRASSTAVSVRGARGLRRPRQEPCFFPRDAGTLSEVK